MYLQYCRSNMFVTGRYQNALEYVEWIVRIICGMWVYLPVDAVAKKTQSAYKWSTTKSMYIYLLYSSC